MNRYEKNLMFNVTVMKVLYVIIVFVNIFISQKKGVFFSLNIFQIILCVAWFFGLLGGLGYFGQKLPIIPLGIIRVLEALYYGLLRGKLNWWVFAIQVMLDIIYFTFLLFDKSNYAYEKEGAVDGVKTHEFE